MFVGEGALDYGGPRREFFRLFCQGIQNSLYFQGYPKSFFSSHVQALQVQPSYWVLIYIYLFSVYVQNGDYRTIGAYAAMSVTQGGPGFPILADSVFTYFSTGITTNLNIDVGDLPPAIKCLVEQVIVHGIVHFVMW